MDGEEISRSASRGSLEDLGRKAGKPPGQGSTQRRGMDELLVG